MSDSVAEKDKGTFKHFSSFMYDNQLYLIPLDNENFKKSVITEDLMNHILHGRQRDVLAFDYTELEEEGQKFKDNFMEVLEMVDDQQSSPDFVTENQIKKRAYQYYYPNRDYGDDLEFL